ncbi:hypothetical protein L6452_18778 [Arctium lappa]|uniref:Uncharacterized protein n=1 Tax=Arctium lappa TaxID=4217 RepID=A0ACB9C741_ARCLA|nr:hypothetical protein L6452_18778 [Arctium lappa]
MLEQPLVAEHMFKHLVVEQPLLEEDIGFDEFDPFEDDVVIETADVPPQEKHMHKETVDMHTETFVDANEDENLDDLELLD